MGDQFLTIRKFEGQPFAATLAQKVNPEILPSTEGRLMNKKPFVAYVALVAVFVGWAVIAGNRLPAEFRDPDPIRTEAT